MEITKTMITETGETVEVISLSEWQQTIEQQEANSRIHRAGNEWNPECKMCGRKMSRKAHDNATHIHMSVNLDLVPVKENIGSNSQGFFPVGSECAKKLPADYKIKF